MEHPSGEYATAIDAMEAAISRLRTLPECTQWISFCAQGEGSSSESIQFAEVRILADILEVGSPVDPPKITGLAKVGRDAFTEAGRTRYSIGQASPRGAALILDALFRHHFGIRPFPDENNDYAVGAEFEEGFP